MAIKSYNLIVLLIMLAAAGGILFAWGVFHFYFDKDDRNPHVVSPQQAMYMQEVRVRSQQSMAMMGRKDIAHDLEANLQDRVGHS